MYDVREGTRAKINQLTALGFRVQGMCECEWNQMINNNPQLKQFVDKLDIVTPSTHAKLFLEVKQTQSNFITKLKMVNRSITVI